MPYEVRKYEAKSNIFLFIGSMAFKKSKKHAEQALAH
jgi:hypothetical protein